MTREKLESWLSDPARPPLVMGVLNVTPDSFSDGGRFADPSTAVDHALAMCEAGANIIDIGGESTRPGSQPVAATEQIQRIVPVFKVLAERASAVLSVDTTSAEVARAAIDHGAGLLNDISGATDDPAMLPLAARTGTPIVLMHMQGQPQTMQVNPTYADVVWDVGEYLRERLAAAQVAGLPRHHVLLDPGIGFGKTIQHNLALMRDLRRLKEIGQPLLLGVSRKGFIGRITNEPDPSQRLFGTAAAVAWSVANGADIVRVHDVEPMKKVVQMVRAIQAGVDF